MLLIYSAIMILGFVKSSEVESISDISDLCTHGRIINYYLTSGLGLSDRIVAMIASDKSLNCNLTFNVKPKRYILLVVELPDLKPNENVCLSKHNASFILSDNKENSRCQYKSSKNIISHISQQSLSALFKSKNVLSTVKVTATSMRDATEKRCSFENEIDCIVDEKVFCMTSKIVCDGHNNCGVPNDFDEDEIMCKGRGLSFLMIIGTIIMGVVSLLLFTSIWMTVLPKRKETFIYKIDETMSLFDSESDIMSSQIDIKILFSNGTKEG